MSDDDPYSGPRCLVHGCLLGLALWALMALMAAVIGGLAWLREVITSN